MQGSRSLLRCALVLAAACAAATYSTVETRWRTGVERVIAIVQRMSLWVSLSIIEPVRAAFKRVLSRFEVRLLIAGPTSAMIAMRDYMQRQVRRFRPTVLPQWRMVPSG